MLQRIKKSVWAVYVKARKTYLRNKTDVYLVSFPKSGRTWVRVFLAKYCSLVTGRRMDLDFDSWIVRKGEPRIMFTHAGYQAQDIFDVERYVASFTGKRVILLIRHPCDVCVSYYHQLLHRTDAEDQRTLGFSPDVTLSAFVRSPRFGLERIVAFMNIIAKRSNSFEELLIVRYEDLRNDPALFQKIILFCGMPLSEDHLKGAQDYADFDNMKKLELQGALDDVRIRPADPDNANSFKVRRGKIGGYKDEFSEEDIEYAEKVLRDLDPTYDYKIN